MEDTIHMILFVMWFIGFGMLLYGVCWQPYYSDFKTDAEYTKASRPSQMYRYIGGAMIVVSMLAYNIFV